MEDVRGKYVSPAIGELAFNCPHCGALAKQFWFTVHAEQLDTAEKPHIQTAATLDEPKRTEIGPDEREMLKMLVRRAEQMATGRPFFEGTQKLTRRVVHNVSISRCFNCNALCLWIYDQLFWPRRPAGPPPSLDLPADVRRDYEEASAILDASPRGAAALLRLAVQKLCKELGEKGENINNDIASLVRKGLNQRVQMALDVVRVIGNDAVHPGQIDLRDDRQTAETLFGLVNLVCEKMITEPKHVDEMYAKLPESKRKQIEKRDTPNKGSSS
jgi:hypothetical protein